MQQQGCHATAFPAFPAEHTAAVVRHTSCSQARRLFSLTIHDQQLPHARDGHAGGRDRIIYHISHVARGAARAAATLRPGRHAQAAVHVVTGADIMGEVQGS